MKKSKAFSLFEISIVTIIIAILMAGVLQSRNIVKKAKLNNARALTVASPVKEIDNLVLWYETTLEKSFSKDEAVDGNSISTWYDLNPNIITVANNATQSTSTKKPTYIESAINGLPAVRFDGTTDALTITDQTPLVESYYTIFVIEQKLAAFTSQVFILHFAGTPYGNGCCVLFGWNTNTRIILDRWGGGVGFTSASFAYTQPVPRMHTVWQNSTGAKYWYNGGSTADSTNTGTALLKSGGGNTGTIAQFTCCAFYKGDLGEIIIYNRALTTEERRSVEDYLSKKWNIPIA